MTHRDTTPACSVRLILVDMPFGQVPIVSITLSNATTDVPTLQQPVFLLTDPCPCFKLEWVTSCATTTGVWQHKRKLQSALPACFCRCYRAACTLELQGCRGEIRQQHVSFLQGLFCCALNYSNLRELFLERRLHYEFLQTGTSGCLENFKSLL